MAYEDALNKAVGNFVFEIVHIPARLLVCGGAVALQPLDGAIKDLEGRWCVGVRRGG